MILQNLHTHTTFCDGKSSAEEMVKAAIGLGMDSLGFSGHSPYPPPFQESWVMAAQDVPHYREEILRLREKYAGQIEIFLGLEQDVLSLPPEDPYDYLIGSVHALVEGGQLIAVDESEAAFCRAVEQYFGGDPLAFAERYYRMVGQVAERTGCQIVGHFDLICKFNEGDRLFDTDHPRYRTAAMEALDALKQRDVILEINTGAMSRGYRTAPYPDPNLLRAMRERNIPICITSDAHSAKDLLHAFPAAVELARECGYQETMYLTRQGFAARPLFGDDWAPAKNKYQPDRHR